MNLFRADLHIHSRYSRATSKSLNPRHLAAWGRVKGLDVLGTGDFTHPGWLQELKDQLRPLDNGLFRLADSSGLSREIPCLAGADFPGRTLFMLQAEISSIYKRDGQVRKVHNLVYVPSFEAAERLNQRLERVGNLKSDGRPILGLDSRNLLEMVLEVDSLAFLVPAHIWTPWFSVFGSKSGFDHIEECFGELTQEIFALETGLSSDPEMNWMWSELDRFRLISNSDAHSGEKLGRETNLFSGEISYEGIYRSLRGQGLGHKFLGTVEFFPEEGKYHLDGHRKCGVALEPGETLARGGLCPVCGKPLTVGVLHRVLALADREAPKRPAGMPGFVSLVPLSELLSEILGKGTQTRAVNEEYARLVTRFGSELNILQDVPPEDLAKVSRPLSLAVSRMRQGKVFRQPGYDGEYGTIRVFTDQERREIAQGKTLAGMNFEKPREGKLERGQIPLPNEQATEDFKEIRFNETQEQAVSAGPGPVLVLAGPGTGKTQTLMGRLQSLVERGHSPRKLLAVTFTRRAAQELNQRLLVAFGQEAVLPRADTLHALGFEYWAQAMETTPVLLDEDAGRRAFAEAAGLDAAQARKGYAEIILAQETRTPVPEEWEKARARYVKHKEHWNLADYSDLLEFWLEKIEHNIYACPYTHVLVDEIQDLTPLQLAVVRALLPASGEGFFGIGAPRQSIYGFRGAQPNVDQALKTFWPDLAVVDLTRNYRSGQPVLDLAHCLFPQAPALSAARDMPAEIRLFEAPSDESEASWIGEQVRRLLGSTSHSLLDEESPREAMSPGDIAILIRLQSLAKPLLRTLDRLGLPVSSPQAEAWWRELRVAALLEAAGRFLGMAENPDLKPPGCPDRVLNSGPGAIADYLGETPPFDRLFWQSQDFRQLDRAFGEHGGWLGLLNWIHLQNELELVSRRSEKVQVMTMHAAKGLEFRAVFLPALEDGLMPFAGPGFFSGKPQSLSDPEEERRLFYVALTRARQALFLSHAGRRHIYGSTLQLSASPFLRELRADLIQRSALVARQKRQEKQLSLM